MASETPATWAISLVVVPRKPWLEKRVMATRRSWSRRSSPAMRVLGTNEVSPGVLIGLLTLCLPAYLSALNEQSKYLLTIQIQALSSGLSEGCIDPDLALRGCTDSQQD